MSEAEGERYTLEGARVYLHVTHHEGERVIHLDVDHPDINEFLLPKEASYAGGREGGLYVGFRPAQLERAETYVQAREPDAQ
jgi:hypothetical protein